MNHAKPFSDTLSDLARRRGLLDLGVRAVNYYIDTGLCVFCNADDVLGVPHEDCAVGEVSGIVVTDERRESVGRARSAMNLALFGSDVEETRPGDCDACYACSPERCTAHARRIG